MRRVSALEAADHFERVAAELRTAPARAAGLIAPALIASVRAQFGKSPPLPALTEATQDDRVMRGYEPNEPLVRTEALEESWEAGVAPGPVGEIAAVGSAEPLAAFHENGFFNVRTGQMVPPRMAGWIGFAAAQPIAQKIWLETVERAAEGKP